MFVWGRSRNLGSDDSSDSTFPDPDAPGTVVGSKRKSKNRSKPSKRPTSRQDNIIRDDGRKRCKGKGKGKTRRKRFVQHQTSLTGDNPFLLLPREVVSIILFHVDPKTRIQCARVCREWSNILATSPEHWKEMNLSLDLGSRALSSKTFSKIMSYAPKVEKLDLTGQSQMKARPLIEWLSGPHSTHLTALDLTGWKNLTPASLEKIVNHLPVSERHPHGRVLKELLIPDHDHTPLPCNLSALVRGRHPELQVLDLRGVSIDGTQFLDSLLAHAYPSLRELHLGTRTVMRLASFDVPFPCRPKLAPLRVLEVRCSEEGVVAHLLPLVAEKLEVLAAHARDPSQRHDPQTTTVFGTCGRVHTVVLSAHFESARYPLLEPSNQQLKNIKWLHVPRMDASSLNRLRIASALVDARSDRQNGRLKLAYNYAHMEDFYSIGCGCSATDVWDLAILCPNLKTCELVSERNLPRHIRTNPMSYIRKIKGYWDQIASLYSRPGALPSLAAIEDEQQAQALLGRLFTEVGAGDMWSKDILNKG